MTSLPIVWGEGASMNDILSGESNPAPIYQHWRETYDLDAVDSFEKLQQSDVDIVILAQPPAMDPADLTILDTWIRDGGRAIVLTDPLLVWPSELPFGDKRRPLATGLLSPLLDHWGLTLIAPDEDEEGIAEFQFSQPAIVMAGAGTFQIKENHRKIDDNCSLGAARVIAKCDIGKGRAVLLADADFLHEGLWLDDQAWKNEGKSAAMLFVDSMVALVMEPGISANSSRLER